MSTEAATLSAVDVDPLVRLRRIGLANSPGDCAEQLACVSDAMASVANDMGWVAEYAEDIDPDTRERLASHSKEMLGASRMAKDWANALMAI